MWEWGRNGACPHLLGCHPVELVAAQWYSSRGTRLCETLEYESVHFQTSFPKTAQTAGLETSLSHRASAWGRSHTGAGGAWEALLPPVTATTEPKWGEGRIPGRGCQRLGKRSCLNFR